MDIIRLHFSTFGMPIDRLTADWVRDKIQHLAKTDVLAYIKAMKEWGIEREKRFSKEGWRKMGC